MFDHSEQVNELAAALAKAQAGMKPAVKNAKNPFFKSNYATLDSVLDSLKKPLSDNGLSVCQIPTGGGLVTVLLHSSGQWVAGCLPLHAEKETPQAFGSAITYARRYALGAITGLATEEDDDGEAAMDQHRKAPPKAKSEPKPEPPKESATSRALAALEKIDDGISLVEWRVKLNKAVAIGRFTQEEVAELEAAYAVKSEKMEA